MRITSSDIRKIEEKFGEFQICKDWKSNLYIRFGISGVLIVSSLALPI